MLLSRWMLIIYLCGPFCIAVICSVQKKKKNLRYYQSRSKDFLCTYTENNIFSNFTLGKIQSLQTVCKMIMFMGLFIYLPRGSILLMTGFIDKILTMEVRGNWWCYLKGHYLKKTNPKTLIYRSYKRY